MVPSAASAAHRRVGVRGDRRKGDPERKGSPKEDVTQGGPEVGAPGKRGGHLEEGSCTGGDQGRGLSRGRERHSR